MVIIISLAILFLFSQYILLEKLVTIEQKEKIKIYEEGYKQGLFDAVITMFQNIDDCKTASLNIGNLTKYVIDITCFGTDSTKKLP